MEVQTENKMGTMPINKLLVNISLPMVVSMLVQALYNIVDSVFVAQIDEYALTAVSLAFPLQNFMIAVAAGTGVGVNALLSKRLGEQRLDEANLAAGNSVFLAGCNYLLFLLIGIGFSDFYFRVQTDIPEIIAYGKIYMFICTACSFGLFGQFCFERLLQATGRTVCTMITQTTGAVLNLIFDPILIFGWFGFPKMGIAGAAAATVFGQIAAMFFGFYYNQKKNKEIRLSVSAIRPQKATLQQIYAVAVPAILMQSIGSVMTFFMNKILLGFTSTAAAVFGVYFKLQSFIFMPVFGLNNGMVPIVAYNYGAREKKRIMQTAWLSIGTAVTIMLVGLGIFHLFTEQLLGIFEASEDMLAIGVPALRIISLSFSFAGYGIVVGSVFQALGNGVYSLMVSVARQLLAILPVAFVLARIGGLSAVWWAFPIAEIVAVVMSTVLFRRIYKLKIQPLTKAMSGS